MTRNELAEMIALAGRLLAADETAVLATLLASRGSTYRRLGSMMVSGPGSAGAGGVSGGCVEQYIARHGRAIVREHSRAAILSFDADPNGTEDDSKPTLGCGGSIEVLVERMTPAHLEFLKQFAAAIDSDHLSTAACVVNTETMRVQRTWIGRDNDGSHLGSLRKRALQTGLSHHSALSDSSRALVHFIPPITRLVIFGAGDDVKPLCEMAHSLSWHVTVADRRARLARADRFPTADAVLIGTDWSEVVEQIVFTPRTAITLMTHSLPDDMSIVPSLMSAPCAYIGALGPEHRRQWLLDGIAETCDVPDEFAERFRGPIGLNLGDRTASGIAVSIASEILAVLNDRQPLTTTERAQTCLAR